MLGDDATNSDCAVISGMHSSSSCDSFSVCIHTLLDKLGT